LAHFGSRKPIAFAQALLMLSLCACSSTQAAKTPPLPTDYKMTVKTEDAPPAAPTPPPAQKPEPAPAPAVKAAPPAPAPGPVVVIPAPSATPPPGTDKSPKTVAGATSDPAAPAPDRGSQPVVRIRQAQTPPAGQPTPQSPGRLVVFNFDNADIEIVLQATSELLVFNYVLAPGARGKKVTVQTTGRIPVDDIFPVLLTILDVNGLAAVKSGNVWRIIPKEGAVQTSTRTIVGPQLDPGVPGDEVITQLIPLQFTSATDVLNLLRPFVPAQGAITATRDTNLLVITDAAANIRRLLDILKLVDVDVALNELLIIPLKNADAQEVAQILTQLFASGRFRPSGAQLPAGIAPPVAPPGPPGAPPAARGQQPPTSPDQSADRAPLIVPERRSNSLIVYARKQEMETIARLVEKLDADIYGGQRVFFYFAENTKAKDLAATLDAIFGRGSGSTSSTSTTTPTTRPTTTGSPGLPSQSSIAGSRTPPVGSTGGTGRGPSFLEDGGPVGETRFIPDEVTNSIIVTTYPRVWTEVEGIIKKLDRMPRQVLIEVLAAEVTLDDSTRLGLQWAIQHGRFSASLTNPPGAATLPSKPPDLIPPFGTALGALSGFNFFTFAAGEFLAAINALASDNKVNVLSSPSIMTAENKKAVINVSRSVPILTSQQVPIGGTQTSVNNQAIVGTQTVEYKDAGIILTVTPRIGEQGTVALDVKQEVNDVGPTTQPTGSPEFLKREAETSVVLLNNQTLVLGGLIQSRRSVTKVGIPFLYSIPVFGYLFGSTLEQLQKTELILLITPRVIGTAIDAARVTDQMRNLTPERRDSIREKQFPYPSFKPPATNP
jgi:general secretion pathway protein D